MRKENQTDVVSRAVEVAISGFAPDYVAPVLISKLVQAAIKIGLSSKDVTDQIDRLFAFHDRFVGN